MTTTASAGDWKRNRAIPWSLLIAALVLVAVTYDGTYRSIVAKWASDSAYSHGYLILPIVAWLMWRKRSELARIPVGPSWPGGILVVGCALLWVVAHGTGVLVVEQFAAVGMIPSLVLAVVGWPTARTLVFPLAFLFFAVPFGSGIVPWLMQATADVATLALQVSGVPVLRTSMQISIPAGDFVVARACSGLSYFVTGVVLGVISGYLNFQSWRKRLICVVAFALIPVLLNGLRVYLIILVSHLTDMRVGPGAEHVTFGRVFFIVMLFLLLWIARRWHDDDTAVSSNPAAPTATPGQAVADWVSVGLAVAAAGLAPAYARTSVEWARARVVDTASLVAMPEAEDVWQGPENGAGRWRPRYTGGLLERQVVYRDGSGKPVDAFVAVYGLGATAGAEMINYSNVVDSGDAKYLLSDRRVAVGIPGGRNIMVRELTVRDGEAWRLVWQWFVVGDRPVIGQFATKAREAMAFVTRSAASERIVTVSTPNDAEGARRLQAFMTVYGACATPGFAAEACGS